MPTLKFLWEAEQDSVKQTMLQDTIEILTLATGQDFTPVPTAPVKRLRTSNCKIVYENKLGHIKALIG